MPWILASLFFVWCAFREIRSSLIAPAGYDLPQPVTKPYLAVVLVLAVIFAWPPVHTWYFQRFLSAKATELADGHRAIVHCNTIFDTMLDSEMLAAGHANPLNGKIGIQHPWCDILSSYLRHPGRASAKEIWSLNMFTHESMHIRGEMNEARTECQAVQRNSGAAKLLGVSRQALSGLLNCRVDLTGDMALRIEKAFGVNLETLIGLQSAYDIFHVRRRAADINIPRYHPTLHGPAPA